jgi:hypothetical protein
MTDICEALLQASATGQRCRHIAWQTTTAKDGRPIRVCGIHATATKGGPIRRPCQPTVEIDLQLARDLLDGTPCRLDHSGNCQEHGWMLGANPRPCPQNRLLIAIEGKVGGQDQPPHPPEDCWFRSVAEDNAIDAPYCNRCIMSEAT